MASKCGYPECAGYPVDLLVTCGDVFCTNQLHHVCQTTTEFNCGIDEGLSKRCYQCLRPIINKNNPAKENVATANSKSSPRPSASPSNDSSDGESSSSSSNRSKTNSINNNQTSHGGKQLRQVIIPENPSSYKPSLKAQTGFINCSLVTTPNLFYYNTFEKQASARQDSHEQYGPYSFGKIIQVPNQRKKISGYVIRYDTSKEVTIVGNTEPFIHSTFTTNLPALPDVKRMLKEAISRANLIDYRFSNTRAKKNNFVSSFASSRQLSTDNKSNNKSNLRQNTNNETSNTLLAGILGETIIEENESDLEVSGDDSDDESLSDEGSNCNMETSAFIVDNDEDEDEVESNFTDINYFWS